ncbi:testis-expressed protein 264-like [Amblyomma americanum]
METDVALLLGIIAVLILLLLTLLGFLSYCGLFAPIDIKAEKPPFQELHVAYKFARGAYKYAGALFTEVHSIAPTLKCIGVYYDDPDEVEVPRLRYLVGVVLNDTERPAAKEVKEQLEAKGFKTASFPAVDHAVTTVFPFHGGAVSVMLVVARVYPKLREYIKEKLLCARPLIEIYEGERVLFVCPLAKQDEFYVEEATEDPEEGATSDPGTTTASEEERADDGEDEDEEEEAEPSPPVSQPVSSNGGANGNTEESDHERGSRSSTTSSFEELRLEAASN